MGIRRIFDGSDFQVDSAMVRFLPEASSIPLSTRAARVPASSSRGSRPGSTSRFESRSTGRDGSRAGDAFVGVGNGDSTSPWRVIFLAARSTVPWHGGVVFANLGPNDSDDDAQGVAVQHDGRILVAGSAAPTAFTFDSDFAVARFLPSGALDPSFGEGGIAVTPTAPGIADDEIFAAAFQGGAKLVASGECDQTETGRDVCVVRYRLGGGDD